MTRSTFEQVLRERGELIYTNVGDSMYPLIKPRDLLVIKPIERPLKRLDIPLYKRDNGQYILHRIVKKRGDAYWLCGDNRTGVETDVTDRHMIGILTAVVRKGKQFSVNNLCCRVYAHLWCFFPLRRVVLYIKRLIRTAFLF